MTRILPNRFQALLAMSVPPPMPPLPRLLSALERIEPGSKAFLPILELFLRSKGELQQLEGPLSFVQQIS